MKFLLRCLLVLAVAVAYSVVLYYAVRALPGNSSTPSPTTVQRPPENGTQAPRPERPENNQGISWRLTLGFVRRVVMFSALVFAAVLGKNFIFKRKRNPKDTPD